MKKITVELYTDQKNGAVLKLPNRQYPGVLIQGDTLHILIDDLNEALEECRLLTGSEDVCEGLEYIIDRLASYKNKYDKVISASQKDENNK
ncbi:DUF6959 family protein [Gimesia aquarii]|uniref:Uncharacterized protein n=1 Tax=Gimesia aquarii TaxID=2527964 RepID=A0A517WSD3_9PLAN|nr:hypothetical protein [Gimesia aquarii]QDU08167.1 hypothetical protein V202x_15310 [Gimesia aquarii]